jgi:FAD/FMN-containing dehydrogenase
MSVRIDDLTGLNLEEMADMPVLADAVAAAALASGGRQVAVAGMRHSQGGHTAVPGGRMALTLAAMNRISSPVAVQGQPWDALVEVECGATWGELHRVLGPRGYAPMVQQSSADFSIGGSLSVNCHSRDPRWGPLVDSVEDITVLTSLGTLTASRTQHADLFAAAIGGYGACGFILKATLRAVANRWLVSVGDTRERTIGEYIAHARELLAQPAGQGSVHLHYAWLCCVEGQLYDRALVADFRDAGDVAEPQTHFYEEEWGRDELLRAGWSAARKSPLKMRQAVWNELLSRHTKASGSPDDGGKGSRRWRIDWFRSAISFTGYRGQHDTEILQEYFVPVDKAVLMLDYLKNLFIAEGRINVLSTTLRVVRPDTLTVMSYCPGAPRICIAVDMVVPTVVDGSGRTIVDPGVVMTLSNANDAALARGGTFYLPYYRVADRQQFARAYPHGAQLKAAMDRYNPVQADGKRRFWNNFLAAYF